ncbi:hypothetical protein EMPS_00332 [Entomortierella parvispora]|uniref:Uncharacterized protein n=1 Tax=Entomortierella parvispora TaxID=205924 RepID=A0A9P3H0I6_9FUNG|nr:hypothetical protein EMPS_00332 [Entomortierella parvispora]
MRLSWETALKSAPLPWRPDGLTKPVQTVSPELYKECVSHNDWLGILILTGNLCYGCLAGSTPFESIRTSWLHLILAG